MKYTLSSYDGLLDTAMLGTPLTLGLSDGYMLADGKSVDAIVVIMMIWSFYDSRVEMPCTLNMIIDR